MGKKNPFQVLIIRHAEETGKDDDPHLSIAGRRRAESLAAVLPRTILRPDYLFAARPSKKSRRSLETVEPLARVLRLEINDKHDDSDCGDVARLLLKKDKYVGRTVLISWQHGRIPELARALGGKGLPKDWPNKAYDRLWRLEYRSSTPTFSDLPQDYILRPR